MQRKPIEVKKVTAVRRISTAGMGTFYAISQQAPDTYIATPAAPAGITSPDSHGLEYHNTPSPITFSCPHTITTIERAIYVKVTPAAPTAELVALAEAVFTIAEELGNDETDSELTSKDLKASEHQRHVASGKAIAYYAAVERLHACLASLPDAVLGAFLSDAELEALRDGQRRIEGAPAEVESPVQPVEVAPLEIVHVDIGPRLEIKTLCGQSETMGHSYFYWDAGDIYNVPASKITCPDCVAAVARAKAGLVF